MTLGARAIAYRGPPGSCRLSRISGVSRAALGIMPQGGADWRLSRRSTFRAVPNLIHPNEELLRTFYAALERGDLGSIEQLIGETIVVRVSGQNALTGTYEGRAEVLAMYRTFANLVGPGFKIPAHDVLANDSSIVVLPAAAGWRTAKKGMDVYHVDRGQIVEIWITEWDTTEGPASPPNLDGGTIV